ncbi:MAG: ABC-2 type transport system permease protein [Planctomycetota bacterium]|jgi:ABC-2 type transport system permease protein
MLNTILTLIGKDLRLFFRDKVAVMLTVLLPVLLATVMGSAMSSMMGGGGGGGGALPKVRLLIQDDDHSEASAKLIEALQGGDGLRITLMEEARGAVRNGDAPAALVIPEGFGAELLSGSIPETRLLQDQASYISQQVISGNLMFALAQVNLELGGPALMRSVVGMLGVPDAGLKRAEQLMESTWGSFDQLFSSMPADADSAQNPEAGGGLGGFDFLGEGPGLLGVVAEDVVSAGAEADDGPPPSAGSSHAFAAMAVMMLMFNLVAAGGGLLDEEASGALLRLRLSPAGGLALLFAKYGFMVVVGSFQLLSLFLFGWIAFDVPVGQHLVPLVVTSLALCLAVGAMGMVFATACRTRKQLEGISTVIILLMSAVGGAWFPREVTPDWFQFLGNFTVTAWAMDAYHGALWYGKGLFATGELDGILPKIVVLLGYASAFILISVVLFRRRYNST